MSPVFLHIPIALAAVMWILQAVPLVSTYVRLLVALSLRGGGSFSFGCLPALCTAKIPGIANFQESLLAFEQIPAKFRENFIEKRAI